MWYAIGYREKAVYRSRYQLTGDGYWERLTGGHQYRRHCLSAMARCLLEEEDRNPTASLQFSRFVLVRGDELASYGLPNPQSAWRVGEWAKGRVE
jgi:hypothetical protein